MEIVDNHGYTALDYAVFSGNAEFEALALEGLRRNFDRKLKDQHRESRLRKGYRHVLEEELLGFQGPEVRRHPAVQLRRPGA